MKQTRQQCLVIIGDQRHTRLCRLPVYRDGMCAIHYHALIGIGIPVKVTRMPHSESQPQPWKDYVAAMTEMYGWSRK